MTNSQVFLKPRLQGGRFENCTIPLDFLKDLAAFDEMILEVAKAEYRKENADRQRIPRHFTKGIEIGLTAIEAGSTNPVFSFILASAILPPPDIHYFEKASNSIVDAIRAASDGKHVSDYIPEEAIAYFDRLGRGLRDGEALVLPSSQGKDATLTKEIRKKILLASPKLREYTEECVVRGMIPEIDQDKLTCQLLYEGRKITVPYATQHEHVILEAVNGYRDKQTKVMLKGVGVISRQGRLLKFESLDSIEVLDPLDIFVQIESIRQLKEGWLDGEGKIPSEVGLNWVVECFDRNLSDRVMPYLYPTVDGGLRAEWSVKKWELSLDVNVDNQSG